LECSGKVADSSRRQTCCKNTNIEPIDERDNCGYKENKLPHPLDEGWLGYRQAESSESIKIFCQTSQRGKYKIERTTDCHNKRFLGTEKEHISTMVALKTQIYETTIDIQKEHRIKYEVYRFFIVLKIQ